jgi:hypothetical protein
MRPERVFTIHAPRDGKIDRIVEEMRVLGPPTIKAVASEDGAALVSIEGCHRLAAAHALGLAPQFKVYQPDDLVDVSNMDIEHMFPDGTTTAVARDVADECFHSGSGEYLLQEDGTLQLLDYGLP